MRGTTERPPDIIIVNLRVKAFGGGLPQRKRLSIESDRSIGI